MPESNLTIAADALRSPLSHLQADNGRGDASLTAAELPHLGYVTLRGHADDAAFMGAAAAVLGAPLPTRPRSVTRCTAGVVLWQSPDEWWLLCARSDRDRLVARLEQALAGCHAQVADNSGGFTALRITGAPHLRLLAHLCPYDFDTLPIGQCVSTVISKASFTVLRSDAQGVTLVFRRSFADYIWRLIARNAQPYGLQFTDSLRCSDPLLSALLAPQEGATRAQTLAA